MGDLKLVGEHYEYDLNYEGYTKYKTFEDEGAFGHDNELEVRIKTLSMERANTIAIYEANSTFVGHYQEQEKMNVIQLWVTDDGTGTPFQKGPNAIVISTSLFGNTKLHSMLEKEQLQQTPLWSPIAGDYQFIAVDRDKNSNSDGASNNVDFVIIRRAISSAQAMEVLDLLMTCYVNESLDAATNLTVYDEAILYTYASTKLNGTKAVHMNLHVDVLGYVPYFSEYKNSDQGQEPNNKNKFTATFVLVVAGIIAAIVVCGVLAVYSGGGTALVMIGLICMLIYMLDAYLPGIAEILTMITAFMIELVMTVLTWLGPLGWLILRAVILALIWMEFAISLTVVILTFSAIALVMYLMSELIDGDTIIKSDSVSVHKDNTFNTIEYKIKMNYIKYWNLDVPTVYLYFLTENTAHEILFNCFTGNIPFPPMDTFEILYNNGSAQSSGLMMSSEGSNESNEQFWMAIAHITGIFGSFMSICSTAISLFEDKPSYRKILAPVAIFLSLYGLIRIIVLTINYIQEMGCFTESYCMGLTIGSLIVAIFALLPVFKGLKINGFLYKIGGGGILFIAKWYIYNNVEIELEPENLWKMLFVIINLIVLAYGVGSLMRLKDEKMRKNVGISFILVAVACAYAFCRLPYFLKLPIS